MSMQKNKKLNFKELKNVIEKYDLLDVDELLIEIGKGNIFSSEVIKPYT